MELPFFFSFYHSDFCLCSFFLAMFHLSLLAHCYPLFLSHTIVLCDGDMWIRYSPSCSLTASKTWKQSAFTAFHSNLTEILKLAIIRAIQLVSELMTLRTNEAIQCRSWLADKWWLEPTSVGWSDAWHLYSAEYLQFLWHQHVSHPWQTCSNAVGRVRLAFEGIFQCYRLAVDGKVDHYHLCLC